MALIKCPECGRQISDKAIACPGCGYSITANDIHLDDDSNMESDFQEKSNNDFQAEGANTGDLPKGDSNIKRIIWICVGIAITLFIGYLVIISDSTHIDDTESSVIKSSFEITGDFLNPTPTPTKSPEEYVSMCKEINYTSLLRYPEQYLNGYISYTVELVNKRDDGSWVGYILPNNGLSDVDYSKTVIINDKRSDSIKLIQNDVVTIYGIFTGLVTDIFNAEIPCIEMYYAELGTPLQRAINEALNKSLSNTPTEKPADSINYHAYSEDNEKDYEKLLDDLFSDSMRDAESDYLIFGSDARYITEEDLYGFNEEMCRLARNEIYARHGRLFTTEAIQEYFDEKSWYYGRINSADFSEDVLNDYEKANVQFIKEFEANKRFDVCEYYSRTEPLKYVSFCSCEGNYYNFVDMVFSDTKSGYMYIRIAFEDVDNDVSDIAECYPFEIFDGKNIIIFDNKDTGEAITCVEFDIGDNEDGLRYYRLDFSISCFDNAIDDYISSVYDEYYDSKMPWG